MGKSVLYLAISIDGYLADERGGVGWLGDHYEHFEELTKSLLNE